MEHGGVVGVRWRLLLALFLPGLFTTTLVHTPAEALAAVTALAALTAALVAVLVVRNPPARQAVPAWSLSLRERSARTAFLRLRDPDAAGRPRPRAPGLRGPAA
ncbi:DUF6412 domain-containing protein [Umezawaea beigongshangensis]|uniref:DUF6412 domain-containing protein n=1 Tax=Umezawaea beigongshangensis TaxID=2780383 RepID=UPI0018F192F2|nr:DUF6412 domain-containing protein [Umezawaea beigongshangensis]